tara:strand:+ start:5489 stop:6127 length:639 start_codon:yes stop_codon:yes gene_type:complete
MCGRYELKVNFEELPSLLKKDFPKRLEQKYSRQSLIKPYQPVLVLKNEGKTSTSIMLWGFISEWAKDPFLEGSVRPFNARAETVVTKKLFKGSWRHKRCLLPATGFFEKNYRITRKDEKVFWLGGIWNRWSSADGSELDSCCVLTTESNELVKPLHNRMPVIIPNGLEDEWIASVKDGPSLKALETIMGQWNPLNWKAEMFDQSPTSQMSLF